MLLRLFVNLWSSELQTAINSSFAFAVCLSIWRKLPLPGHSEVAFRSSSQAATYFYLYNQPSKGEASR